MLLYIIACRCNLAHMICGREIHRIRLWVLHGIRDVRFRAAARSVRSGPGAPGISQLTGACMVVYFPLRAGAISVLILYYTVYKTDTRAVIVIRDRTGCDAIADPTRLRSRPTLLSRRFILRYATAARAVLRSTIGDDTVRLTRPTSASFHALGAGAGNATRCAAHTPGPISRPPHRNPKARTAYCVAGEVLCAAPLELSHPFLWLGKDAERIEDAPIESTYSLYKQCRAVIGDAQAHVRVLRQAVKTDDCSHLGAATFAASVRSRQAALVGLAKRGRDDTRPLRRRGCRRAGACAQVQVRPHSGEQVA